MEGKTIYILPAKRELVLPSLFWRSVPSPLLLSTIDDFLLENNSLLLNELPSLFRIEEDADLLKGELRGTAEYMGNEGQTLSYHHLAINAFFGCVRGS